MNICLYLQWIFSCERLTVQIILTLRNSLEFFSNDEQPVMRIVAKSEKTGLFVAYFSCGFSAEANNNGGPAVEWMKEQLTLF